MYKLIQFPKSTQNSDAGKKIQIGKKTQFLLSQSILNENDTKVIFSTKKKKYGTFAPPHLFFVENQVFLIIALIMIQFTRTHNGYSSGDIHYINQSVAIPVEYCIQLQGRLHQFQYLCHSLDLSIPEASFVLCGTQRNLVGTLIDLFTLIIQVNRQSSAFVEFPKVFFASHTKPISGL